jgi:hypothetical protein
MNPKLISSQHNGKHFLTGANKIHNLCLYQISYAYYSNLSHVAMKRKDRS